MKNHWLTKLTLLLPLSVDDMALAPVDLLARIKSTRAAAFVTLDLKVPDEAIRASRSPSQASGAEWRMIATYGRRSFESSGHTDRRLGVIPM